jgi:dolichol-phosphate mannosyltransferase
LKSIVIIPTYKEKDNIEKIIRKVFSLKVNLEILIIDDNSPDGTADIVKKLRDEEFSAQLHIIERDGKLGLGTAYITGFKWCLEMVMITFLRWMPIFLIIRMICLAY